jgi:hypothetical protein
MISALVVGHALTFAQLMLYDWRIIKLLLIQTFALIVVVVFLFVP